MQLKIISYNIWDLPLWFVKNRKKRIEDVVKYLISSGADIICIQESWHLGTRKEVLYKSFSEAGYQHASGRDMPMVYGNSGLVTFSKFPIRSKHFSKFPFMFGAFVELFTGRGILETIIETPAGLLRVFNTHLHMPDAYHDRSIRLRQIRSAFDFIKSREDVPSIIAGDFNEDQIWNAPDFMTFFDQLRFRFPLFGKPESHAPTYRPENPYVDMWPNNPDRPKRFDYIFVNGIEKLGLKEISHQPLYLDPILSDHDPVEVVLAKV
jgi:endonuclease/exonuclease/phosphatase family metal-dependent hydrolase